MKNIASTIASALLFLAVAAVAVYGVSRNWSIEAYSPPNSDALYYAEYDDIEGQSALVRLKADGGLTLIRAADYGDGRYSGTMTDFELKGHYLKPVVGRLYISDGYIPLPFLGKPDTRAMEAELTCVRALAYNATEDTAVGSRYNDRLYFSDSVFYMGDMRLDYVETMPTDILRVYGAMIDQLVAQRTEGDAS